MGSETRTGILAAEAISALPEAARDAPEPALRCGTSLSVNGAVGIAGSGTGSAPLRPRIKSSMIGHGNDRRPGRPAQVQVNFYEQITELHKIARLLYSGYSAWLDAHEELQIEYNEYLDNQ
jgi:hypothetical protein